MVSGLRDDNEDVRKQSMEVLCALVMYSHEGLATAKHVLTHKVLTML
jgi:hypothetical protein